MILFQCSVPMPPSANNVFLNVAGRGRVRSKAYRAWAEEAGWMVKSRMNGMVTDPISVRIELCPKNRRAYDIDNRIKPSLDLLVACGVIPDDSNKYIRQVMVREVPTGPECTITLEEIEG